MSWGERSCKKYGSCKRENATIMNCNVDCPEYERNWEIKPDSFQSKTPEPIEGE